MEHYLNAPYNSYVDDSALTLYLPLISAVIGAFIGAAVAGLFRYAEDKLARRQERKSLLLLIDAEVHDHMDILKRAQKAMQEIERVGYGNVAHDLWTMKTVDWEASKQRLAQLLPSKYMEHLIIYYMGVSHTETSVSFAVAFLDQLQSQSVSAKPNLRATMLKQDADNLLPLAESIRTMCQHFAGYSPVYLDLQTYPAPEGDSPL